MNAKKILALITAATVTLSYGPMVAFATEEMPEGTEETVIEELAETEEVAELEEPAEAAEAEEPAEVAEVAELEEENAETFEENIEAEETEASEEEQVEFIPILLMALGTNGDEQEKVIEDAADKLRNEENTENAKNLIKEFAEGASVEVKENEKYEKGLFEVTDENGEKALYSYSMDENGTISIFKVEKQTKKVSVTKKEVVEESELTELLAKYEGQEVYCQLTEDGKYAVYTSYNKVADLTEEEMNQLVANIKELYGEDSIIKVEKKDGTKGTAAEYKINTKVETRYGFAGVDNRNRFVYPKQYSKEFVDAERISTGKYLYNYTYTYNTKGEAQSWAAKGVNPYDDKEAGATYGVYTVSNGLLRFVDESQSWQIYCKKNNISEEKWWPISELTSNNATVVVSRYFTELSGLTEAEANEYAEKYDVTLVKKAVEATPDKYTVYSDSMTEETSYINGDPKNYEKKNKDQEPVKDPEDDNPADKPNDDPADKPNDDPTDKPDDGGHNGGGSHRDHSTKDEVLTEIADEEVPLADMPTDVAEEVEIEDEEVPLADLPATGGMGVGLFLLAGAALAGAGVGLRRKDD